MILQEYCRTRNAREEEIAEIRKKILLTELAAAEIKKESEQLRLCRENELLEAAIAENQIKQLQRAELEKKLRGMLSFHT
jgi:hypothetical protein